MKSRKWVITGVALFAISVLCLGFTAIALFRDYEVSRLNTSNYALSDASQSNVNKQYEFNQGDTISVQTEAAEVIIVEESRDDISFEYFYGQLLYNGQPTTTVDSSRSGSGVEFTEELLQRVRVQLTPFAKNSRLVVRVPEGGAGDVTVRGNSDIYVNEGINCQNLDLSTSFGEVSVGDAVVAGDATLHSASGSVSLLTAEVGGDVKLTTSFGGVAASEVTATNLSGVSSSGNVLLNDIAASGEVKGDTSFGTASANDVACNDLRLSTDSGSANAVRVTVEKDVQLKSNFGSVLMHESTAKNATLNSDSGSVTFEKSKAEYATLDTNFGKVLFDPAAGCNADLSTDSGRVDIIWPRDAGLTLDAETSAGRISINLGGNSFSSEHYVFGDGAFAVKARSDFGGINVHEASSSGR